MAFTVCSAADVPVEQWRVLSRDSLFSSPAFVSIWEAWGGRPVFFLEHDNGCSVAGMAGIIMGHRLIRHFESMADGLYGGAFYAENTDESVRGAFEHNVVRYLKSRGVIRADIHHPDHTPESGLYSRSPIGLHVIPLSGDDFKPAHPKVREHLRSAERGGAEVCRFTDAGRMDEFYGLVEQTESRHGCSPRYPRSLFEKLFSLAAHDERIIWLAVLFEDRMIASRISLVERGQMLNWQSFFDKQYSRLRPNYLLMQDVIRFAQQRGIHEVNLGWSPPGADSLVEFKERWGGQKTEYTSYTWMSRWGKLINRLRTS